MKKLNKFLLSLTLSITSNLISFDANAFDKFITVKFKNPPSAKFIKELNKMTNTAVVKSEKPATYVLKLTGIANNDTLDRFSELFTIMQSVASVSPVPKEKTDDKINPQYYVHNSIQNNSVAKEVNPVVKNDQETQIIINDELIVKYNDGVTADDISIINNTVGGTSSLMTDNKSYKIKLPENVDPETAISMFQNTGRVESVEQNKVVITKNNDVVNSTSDQMSSSTTQSGIITTIPLTKRDVKVTFKIGEEEEAMDWFKQVFGAQLVSKKGFSTYILRFPDNFNVKMVVRALKVCSTVANVEVSSD